MSKSKSILFTHAAGFCAEVWTPVLGEHPLHARTASWPA